jgi:predicted DNA-binding transcriptional regulator AlpA
MGTDVASADNVTRRDGTLTRKQAVEFLGMNDTEFALRLIWDAQFPKTENGSFRASDVVAWMDARAGALRRAPARHR